MNKWLLSMILFLSFTVVLFINLQSNSEVGNQFSTNLEDVTNEEMEAVILENPNIFPMRVALANRYFDEVDYSNALPHYMYVAENSDESEIKSFALAQIAWMVFESGNTEVATNYLNESLNINNTISEMSVFAWVKTTYNSGTPGVWGEGNWSIIDFDRSEKFQLTISNAGEVAMAGNTSDRGNIGISSGGGFSGQCCFDIVGDTRINDGEWHYVGYTFSVLNQIS